MSFFYLGPVKGDVPIHLLEEIVINRLEYLKRLSRGDTLCYNEYVIEGSVYDNVGHFLFCIIVALLKNKDFTQFFLNSEAKLFNQRISSLSAYDLRCFSKKLLQFIRKLDTTVQYIQPLQQLCRHLILKNIAHHISSPQHTEDCGSYTIKLHFRHCLTFVAKRQVEISKGVAILPCERWKQYLFALYKTSLLHKLRQAQQYSYEHDPRLSELMTKVQSHLHLKQESNMNALMSKDVDKMSQYFPPCMSNLHQCLRSSHRLSHNQRFYYSLFLKDIGMPIEEAIDFWKSEYNQVPKGSHKCNHSWEKDEKKFVYGIRHMYGLEGRRKSYNSNNCKKIQNMDNSCQEGGCPFKSFDDANLLQTLKLSISEPILSQIFHFKKKEKYTSACLLFLKRNLKTEINHVDLNYNFSPVKFFTIAYESF